MGGRQLLTIAFCSLVCVGYANTAGKSTVTQNLTAPSTPTNPTCNPPESKRFASGSQARPFPFL